MITNLAQWLTSRKRTKPVTTIVLHSTAGKSAESSISWLRQIGNSYHAIVADGTGRVSNGGIIKCVPDMRVAFHAGKSNGPDGPNVNDYSLGISFASMDDDKDFITEEQWYAAVERCAEWIRAYPSIKWITTHKAVSPGRKWDPRGPVEGMGRGFDLDAFVSHVNLYLHKEGRQVKAWGKHG